MKQYIWTDGKIYESLPAIMDNTSPISEVWWLAHGGSIENIPDPEPEPEPETTHTYSKYKIKLACEAENLWEEVKSYIDHSGKWESFLLINDISSDNAEFQQVLPTLYTAFGEEIVNRVLEASEI